MINKLLLRFSILFGGFYILFVLWLRIILERLPRNIFLDASKTHLIIYFFLFVVSLFIVFFSLYKIFKIRPKYKILNKYPLIQKIIIIIYDILLKGPQNFYEFLYKRVKIRPMIDNICKQMTINSINEKPFWGFFFFYFKYFCLFLILLSFCYDVFIKERFEFFYKFLIISLIPIILDIFLFVIKNLASKNKKIIEKWMSFPANDKKDGFKMSLNLDVKDNPFLQIQDRDLLLKIMSRNYEAWYYYLYACMTIDNFYALETKYKSYLYLLFYSIYAFGWGYILYYNLSY